MNDMTGHNVNIRGQVPEHPLSKTLHPYTSLPYPNQHYTNYTPIKDEMVLDSKHSIGVPLPASKPKIWSLADTAACKTPPPNHINPGWMNSQPLNPANCGSIPINMQSIGSNNINFACSPYNRYGGFLPGNHQVNNNIGAHGSLINMVAQQPLNQLLNNSYDNVHAVDHSSNSQTNNLRNLHQQHGLGFPEIQTDTPPQTPPNQKHPCNTVNNSLTPTTMNHANVTCFTSSNNNMHMITPIITNIESTMNQTSGFTSSPNSNNYNDNYSHMQQNSPQQSNVKQSTKNLNEDNAAFKPFFKR